MPESMLTYKRLYMAFEDSNAKDKVWINILTPAGGFWFFCVY